MTCQIRKPIPSMAAFSIQGSFSSFGFGKKDAISKTIQWRNCASRPKSTNLAPSGTFLKSDERLDGILHMMPHDYAAPSYTPSNQFNALVPFKESLISLIMHFQKYIFSFKRMFFSNTVLIFIY